MKQVSALAPMIAAVTTCRPAGERLVDGLAHGAGVHVAVGMAEEVHDVEPAREGSGSHGHATVACGHRPHATGECH